MFMPDTRIGKPAPDVILETIDGKAAGISDYWGDGRSLLVIFLRHLA
jgi:peroxiredoxin